MFILHVIEAKYITDHIIWIAFSDGNSGNVDLSGELDGPVFEQLKIVKYFKTFQIRGHTISWDNGADFAPEFLRECVKSIPVFTANP